MTRMEKFNRERILIEIENNNHLEERVYILTHQEEIKKEKRCKH